MKANHKVEFTVVGEKVFTVLHLSFSELLKGGTSGY